MSSAFNVFLSEGVFSDVLELWVEIVLSSSSSLDSYEYSDEEVVVWEVDMPGTGDDTGLDWEELHEP